MKQGLAFLTDSLGSLEDAYFLPRVCLTATLRLKLHFTHADTSDEAEASEMAMFRQQVIVSVPRPNYAQDNHK